MILFRPEHVEPILSGRKTQTRRLGKRRWKVGGIHGCYTRPPFAKGGAKPFCRVRVTGVRRERMLNISPSDVVAEGYDDIQTFVHAFWRINEGRLDPRSDGDVLVWVVEFQVVA